MLIAGTNFTAGTSFIIFSLYVMGLMLLLTDFVQHKHYLSVLGVLLLLGGFIGILASERDLYEVFVAVIVAVAVIMLIHLAMLYATKREWINSYAEKQPNSLIGQEGVATTDVGESGHVLVNGTNILVSALAPVSKGKRVRIVGISEEKIFVEEIN